MTDGRRSADLDRIAEALAAANAVLRRYTGPELAYEMKGGHSPVTEADHEVDALLRRMLPQPGDGWLSEETADGPERLGRARVWVVDPIDGTRSFLAGRPEYSVSVGLVQDGVPLLGGVTNPMLGVTVLGGPDLGVTVQGELPALFPDAAPAELRVLGSRSEWKRGEWARWLERGLAFQPVGSVAWKLALVAAGAADATWTFRPKSEWDVAAGVALVAGAGGSAWVPGEGLPRFNRPRPRFPAFAAARAGLGERVAAMLADTRG